MKDMIKVLGTDAVRGSIACAARNAAVNGSGVDLAGYDGAFAEVTLGAAWSAAMGTHVIHLEDSDDNATFTAVDAKYLQGTAITISGQAVGRAWQGETYTGGKRYVRAVGAHTGGATNCTFGVNIVRGWKRHV
jgi:hypothetical protein